MKKLFLIILVFGLSGCVGTATVVSCAANSKQYPEKEAYDLYITAKISTESGDASKSIPMQCTYKERHCGGGDWYFKWNETRDQDLTFDLGKGKYFSVEIPNCTMALEYLGKNYPYGTSALLFNGQKFSVSNEELSQVGAKSVMGVQLLSVSVSEAANE